MNRSARNRPAIASATSVAPSTTWLPEGDRASPENHAEARSRARSTASRDTSKDESSTSQSSMSSTAWVTVSPSVAASSAIGGTISAPSSTIAPRNSSNVEPAASAFGSRWRSRSDTGVRSRTTNTAIRAGITTGDRRRISHSAATTAAAMTSSRQA